MLQNRGQGEGKDYIPWLKINDVPSTGLASRVKGWKTGRVHHLFSEHLELAYFYLLEWDERVVDIREQYPLLPIEKTLYIAESLGIIHPRDPNQHWGQILLQLSVYFPDRVSQYLSKDSSAKEVKISVLKIFTNFPLSEIVKE